MGSRAYDRAFAHGGLDSSLVPYNYSADHLSFDGLVHALVPYRRASTLPYYDTYGRPYNSYLLQNHTYGCQNTTYPLRDTTTTPPTTYFPRNTMLQELDLSPYCRPSLPSGPQLAS